MRVGIASSESIRILTAMDFQRLLSELTETGMSDVAIAKAVGSTQPTISRLRRGVAKQPLFPLGQALIDLHTTRTRGDVNAQSMRCVNEYT